MLGSDGLDSSGTTALFLTNKPIGPITVYVTPNIKRATRGIVAKT